MLLYLVKIKPNSNEYVGESQTRIMIPNAINISVLLQKLRFLPVFILVILKSYRFYPSDRQ